jgi:hypothetical protein
MFIVQGGFIVTIPNRLNYILVGSSPLSLPLDPLHTSLKAITKGFFVAVTPSRLL